MEFTPEQLTAWAESLELAKDYYDDLEDWSENTLTEDDLEHMDNIVYETGDESGRFETYPTPEDRIKELESALKGTIKTLRKIKPSLNKGMFFVSNDLMKMAKDTIRKAEEVLSK